MEQTGRYVLKDRIVKRISAVLLVLCAAPLAQAATTEFCLRGEFDLSLRLQGWNHASGEWMPATWCLTTDDITSRVQFSATGKSNPDMSGDWTVAFLPPDLVRIVNRASPPDVEFNGAPASEDAARYQRIDPRRLHAEILESSEWTYDRATGEARLRGDGESARVVAKILGDKVAVVSSVADLPLRGRVPVTWRWTWTDPVAPELVLSVDGEAIFRARGTWRELNDEERAMLWRATRGADPVQVPGDNWPAKINMRTVELGSHTWLVRGVRTGFQHLVVDTADGLVVADAPAGWVELQQIPPSDLVPGKGISGLSQDLIEYLEAEFPGRPVHAVVITHAHDDHAGGARAFAAAGARVYAPAISTPFLARALNRDTMPDDELDEGKRVSLYGVVDRVAIADRVEVISTGPGPHVNAAVGVHAPGDRVFFVSDLHVPSSEIAIPRADRATTECWFAAWAVTHLPPGTRVVNSHTAPMTPVSRLARYLEHPDCLAFRAYSRELGSRAH